MDQRKHILTSLLLGAVWGLVGTAGALIINGSHLATSLSLEARPLSELLLWAAVWFGGGLLTGVLLHWSNHTIRWQRILLLAFGWALASLLRWQFRMVLGSLIMVLVVRQAAPRIGFNRSLIIMGGWCVGLAFPKLFDVISLAMFATPAGQFALASLSGVFLGIVNGVITGWQVRQARWGESDSVTRAHNWRIWTLVENLDRNPIMRRLVTRDIERQVYTITGAAFALSIVGLIVSMSIWSKMQSPFAPRSVIIPFVLYLITLAPTARAPLVVSSITALLTASEANKQQFDLLQLTPLSEREVAWTYSIGPLRMLRGLLAFEYIVMLLMLTGSICAFLPSFVTAGSQQVLGGLIGAVMLSLGILGMNLLAAAVGMRVALWWRDPSVAAVVAPLLTLAIILLSLLTIVLGLETMSAGPAAEVMIGFFLFMLAPYLFAIDIMDTTQPWQKSSQMPL